MSRATADHDHDDGTAAVDWWRVLDVAVWIAVVAIAVMGLEWLVGLLVRERIARGANRYLAARTAKTAEPPAA